MIYLSQLFLQSKHKTRLDTRFDVKLQSLFFFVVAVITYQLAEELHHIMQVGSYY